MTTHNTGNPVPSTAVKDLYDNAENLDIAMNTDYLAWLDRLGKWRPTMAGLEKRVNDVLAGTGLSHLEGDYQVGGVVVSHNQWFDGPDGAAWKLIASVPVPFTFTGDFDADRVNFQPIPDLALRGELESRDEGKGAALVGWERGALSDDITTVGQMLDGQAVNLWEFAHLAVRKGATYTDWDWSPAFQAAINYCAANRGKSLFLPAGRYSLESEIVVNDPLVIAGEGPYRTTFFVKHSNPDQYVFKCFPAPGSYGISGLEFYNFGVNFKTADGQSESNFVRLSGISDLFLCQSLIVDRVAGHAVHFTSANNGTYNVNEGCIFDNTIIIGCDKSDKATTKPLIYHDDTVVTNEVYFRECKLYPNRQTHDTSAQNNRSAIRSVSGLGWSITGCAIVSVHDVPVIAFGLKDDGTLGPSRGHRVFDNLFENVQKVSKTGRENCLVFMGDSAASITASRNYIGPNRFEYPVSPDMFYVMECTHFRIDAPDVKADKISTSGPLNDSATFGNGFIQCRSVSNSDGYSSRIFNEGNATVVQGGVISEADARIPSRHSGIQPVFLEMRRRSSVGADLVRAGLFLRDYTNAGPTTQPDVQIRYVADGTTHVPAKFRRNLWKFTPVSGTLPVATIWDDATGGLGTIAVSFDSKTFAFNDGTAWRHLQSTITCTASSLPASSYPIGTSAFATDVGKPVWHKGSGIWVYADGTTV